MAAVAAAYMLMRNAEERRCEERRREEVRRQERRREEIRREEVRRQERRREEMRRKEAHREEVGLHPHTERTPSPWHADYDRKFTTKELNNVIRSLCGNVTDEEIKILVEKTGDSDKDLDFAEFANIMAEGLVYHEIKDAFKHLDQDDDGMVTAEELKTVMSNRGEKYSSSEVSQIIDELDKNHDRRINYSEFCNKILHLMFDAVSTSENEE